jgi:hypothetical protein
MKRVLLVSSLLLLLASPAARAVTVNLAWGPLCYPGNPVSATTFACDTDGPEGDRVVTVSFTPGAAIPDVIAVEWSISGQPDFDSPWELPDWWRLEPGGCRAGKVSFYATPATGPTATCADWTEGRAVFMAPSVYQFDARVIRFDLGCAIDASDPASVVAGQEYYAGGVTILNGRTVGTGACAGCSTGMDFMLSTLAVTGLSGMRDEYHEWNYPGSPHPYVPHLFWNSTSTPTRNTTWGQVKGLYR